ncbi:hypothetical protein J4763_14945 [Burkholderia pseudomallei]|uniref:hypothetical protein n=1 Tax=Burkholderia pseudomallei TaxID=28450 RepID=UPI001AAFB8CA|nr:hypothetical protein [Burkholderia pseudomallei]MBO2972989.1 hypothetical protein [Burkholderia pseudomallei]MBO3058086.1 hypothetical protein [Burkholderia pseudomallei]
MIHSIRRARPRVGKRPRQPAPAQRKCRAAASAAGIAGVGCGAPPAACPRNAANAARRAFRRKNRTKRDAFFLPISFP